MIDFRNGLINRRCIDVSKVDIFDLRSRTKPTDCSIVHVF